METNSFEEQLQPHYLYLTSKNVLLSKKDRPCRALVVSDTVSGKIVSVFRESQLGDRFPVLLERVSLAPLFVDLGELFVLPGAVDTFTHLNLDYHSIWSISRAATRTAASSGTTTIIDYPMMRQQGGQPPSESEILIRRAKILENSVLSTDVGLMAHYDHQSTDLEELVRHPKLLGLQLYLTPPYQQGLPYLDKDQLAPALRRIHKTRQKIALGIYCDFGSSRELALSSPYRLKPLESRLAHEVNIDLSLTKDGYADGEVSQRMKLSTSQYSNISDFDTDSLKEGSYSKRARSHLTGENKSGSSQLKLMQSQNGAGSDRKPLSNSPIRKDRFLDRGPQNNEGDRTPNCVAIKKLSHESYRQGTLRSLAKIEILSYRSSSESNYMTKSSRALKEASQDDDSPKFNVMTDEEEEEEVDLDVEEEYFDSDSPTLEREIPDPLNFHEQFSERLSEGGVKKAPSDYQMMLKTAPGPGLGHKREKSEKFLKKEDLALSNRHKNKETSFINQARDLKQWFLENIIPQEGQGKPPSPTKKETSTSSTTKEPKKIKNITIQAAQSRLKLQKMFRNLPKRKGGISSLQKRRKNFQGAFNLQIDKKGSAQDIEKIRYDYNFYSGSRPMIWQLKAAQILIESLKETPKPKFTVALLNVSSASVLSYIRDYNIKKKSRRIHPVVLNPHIFFCSEKIAQRGTAFKGGQPIRDRGNRKLMIYHAKVNNVACVASGHMYVPKYLKNIDHGCLIKNFNGFNIQALWTHVVLQKVKPLVKKLNQKFMYTEEEIRGLFDDFELEIIKLSRVVSRKPAEVFNLDNKGVIEVGRDADFVVFDPFKTRKSKIDTKLRDLHMYKGQQFIGSIEATFLRGKCVFARKKYGDLKICQSVGQIIERSVKTVPGFRDAVQSLENNGASRENPLE